MHLQILSNLPSNVAKCKMLEQLFSKQDHFEISLRLSKAKLKCQQKIGLMDKFLQVSHLQVLQFFILISKGETKAFVKTCFRDKTTVCFVVNLNITGVLLRRAL